MTQAQFEKALQEVFEVAVVRYYYGMRLRGAAPFCQPKNGLTDILPETECGGRWYYNILEYNRMLTEEEMRDYELDYLYFD